MYATANFLVAVHFYYNFYNYLTLNEKLDYMEISSTVSLITQCMSCAKVVQNRNMHGTYKHRF
jgi:hypothetical protein